MQSASELSDLRINEAPRTLREMALERMRAAILAQRFESGARLIEREIGAHLGVSRSVVREVIRHLEAEGLVQTVPHQGPIVARLDAGTAAQIYEIRGFLEANAAAAAAAKANELDVVRMDQSLADIGQAYAARNYQGVLEATTRFYENMFKAASKQVAWEMVQRLNGRISRLRSLTIASSGRNKSGPAQMRKIVDAIRAHDPDAAHRACLEHVRRAADIAQALIDPTQP